MSGVDDFRSLVQRVRNGEQDAAAELVRRYEPDLRIIARAKLFDPRLRQLMDSMDVCQSIFGNFFARAFAGQFDLDTPDQLKKLLAKMVRNKVIDYARRSQSRGQMSSHRVQQDVGDMEGNLLVDSQPSVGGVIAANELVDEFRKRLTEPELQIFERRLTNRSWEEIGKSLDLQPDTVRKRLTRAIDRITLELGIDGA